MSSTTTRARLSRRHFLLGVGAGGAAAAAAIVSQTKSTGPDESKTRQSQSQSGYRVTEHVQNYYRTARI
jgi:hypothetical protein